MALPAEVIDWLALPAEVVHKIDNFVVEKTCGVFPEHEIGVAESRRIDFERLYHIWKLLKDSCNILRNKKV